MPARDITVEIGVVVTLAAALVACAPADERPLSTTGALIAGLDDTPRIRTLTLATSRGSASSRDDSANAYLTVATLEDATTGLLRVQGWVSDADFSTSSLELVKSDPLTMLPPERRSSFEALSASWTGNHWVVLRRGTRAGAPARFWVDAMLPGSPFNDSNVVVADLPIRRRSTDRRLRNIRVLTSGTRTLAGPSPAMPATNSFIVATLREVDNPNLDDSRPFVEVAVLLVEDWVLEVRQELVVDAFPADAPDELDLALIPDRAGPGDGWLVAYERPGVLCAAFVRGTLRTGASMPPASATSPMCGSADIPTQLTGRFAATSTGDLYVDRVVVAAVLSVDEALSGLSVAGQADRFRQNRGRYLLAFEREAPDGPRLIAHRFDLNSLPASAGASTVRTTDYGPTPVTTLGVETGGFLRSHALFLDYDANSQAHWLLGYWDVIPGDGSLARLNLRWLGGRGETTAETSVEASAPYLAAIRYDALEQRFAMSTTRGRPEYGIYGDYTGHSRLARSYDVGFGCNPMAKIKIKQNRPPYAGDDSGTNYFAIGLQNGPQDLTTGGVDLVEDLELHVSSSLLPTSEIEPCKLALDMTAPRAQSFALPINATGSYTMGVGLGDGADHIYDRPSDQWVLPVAYPESLPQTWAAQWSWKTFFVAVPGLGIEGGWAESTSPVIWIVIDR